MTEQILVKHYDRLIHKLAWKYSQRWNIDEPEIYAEGLYIFVSALNKFEKEKGVKFITHLYNRLSYLMNRYGDRESLQIHRFIPWDEEDMYFKEIPDRLTKLFIKGLEFYESAATELSEDAKEVLGMILDSLEVPFSRKPSLYGTTRHFQLFFGWPPLRTERAWKKVGDWWKKFNLTFSPV